MHQLNPAVAGALANREGRVAHPQARMPALLDVQGRSAEAINQEIPQPLFRARKIVCGIHRAEHVILRNLPVERRH